MHGSGSSVGIKESARFYEEQTESVSQLERKKSSSACKLRGGIEKAESSRWVSNFSECKSLVLFDKLFQLHSSPKLRDLNSVI